MPIIQVEGKNFPASFYGPQKKGKKRPGPIFYHKNMILFGINLFKAGSREKILIFAQDLKGISGSSAAFLRKRWRNSKTNFWRPMGSSLFSSSERVEEILHPARGSHQRSFRDPFGGFFSFGRVFFPGRPEDGPGGGWRASPNSLDRRVAEMTAFIKASLKPPSSMA